MSYPNVKPQYFQEKSGVYAVARLVNEMRCVWRETPNADVGIDGQIELVNDEGFTTGQIVAAQIKSGESYFKEKTDTGFRFRPEEKHRNYWAVFPMPVMLILHEPDENWAIWADARQQLRSPYSGNLKVIEVAKKQRLTSDCRSEFFQTTGPIGGRVLGIDQIVKEMATCDSGEYDFEMSYLDLFVLGMADSARKLFFSMGLCSDIAEIRSAKKGLIVLRYDPERSLHECMDSTAGIPCFSGFPWDRMNAIAIISPAVRCHKSLERKILRDVTE